MGEGDRGLERIQLLTDSKGKPGESMEAWTSRSYSAHHKMLDYSSDGHINEHNRAAKGWTPNSLLRQTEHITNKSSQREMIKQRNNQPSETHTERLTNSNVNTNTETNTQTHNFLDAHRDPRNNMQLTQRPTDRRNARRHTNAKHVDAHTLT